MEHQLTPQALTCSRLTAAGRGAIAVVEVKGNDAESAIGNSFRPLHGKSFSASPNRSLTYGRWLATGEDVVVRRVAEQYFEVHCHGGSAAVASILDSLAMEGAIETQAGQQTHSAQQHKPAARWRAEVWQALPQAQTERTASLLLRQLTLLPAAIAEIQTLIEHGDDAAATERAKHMLDWSSFGISLTRVPSVVLTGQPNVGKSSLINAIVGFQRAIVHETAGTTRDIVSQRTAIDGWPIELADTAGLREATGPIERLGIENARQRVESAHVVIGVFDASQPWTESDQANLESLGCDIVVYNKYDQQIAAEGRPPGIDTSATTNQGIDQLVTAIATALVPSTPPDGTAFCISEEQAQRLEQVLAAINRPQAETVDRAAVIRMLEQIPD